MAASMKSAASYTAGTRLLSTMRSGSPQVLQTLQLMPGLKCAVVFLRCMQTSLA